MYTYKIKDKTLTIHRVTYDNGLTQWYYDVDNSGIVNDHYHLKRSAKLAGIEYISSITK